MLVCVRSVVRYINLLNEGLFSSVIARAMPIDEKFFLNPINFLFCFAFSLVFNFWPNLQQPSAPIFVSMMQEFVLRQCIMG